MSASDKHRIVILLPRTIGNNNDDIRQMYPIMNKGDDFRKEGRYVHVMNIGIAFFYSVLSSTNVQLFHKLSHSYMFRHSSVIPKEFVINALPSYRSISNSAVGNTIYTDWLHENCHNIMILAHFIVNRTILMF